MAKITLVNGTSISGSIAGIDMLSISTTDLTAEELHELFSDKENTSCITVEYDTGAVETKAGYTSYSGIMIETDGSKTVRLFQPTDATEARISNAEGTANAAMNTAKEAVAELDEMAKAIEEGVNAV